ncbi:MAG TPA: DUF1844 domain-containing protein [Gemmatimonadota bacterium]|nr:DUF1844 domain-containing protein [Gemmatimonadota bacterium]
MTESKFRERRSAHRDESEAEASAPPDGVAAPDVTAEPASPSDWIPEPASDRIPEPVSQSDRIAEAVPAQSPPPPPAESETDLDQLEDMEVPEPSFLELIEPHIEMALRFLGELPLTPEGERRVLPRWAKREIDLLGLLEQRTRGNLPPPEQEFLQQALDHLRTMYLKVSR